MTIDVSWDVVSSAGWKLVGFGFLVGSGLVVLLVPRPGRARPMLLLAIGSALVLFASSGLGWSYWARQDSSGETLAIQSDQNQTDLGLALNEVVAPGGSVALVQAGAPAYYADRASEDLLGKSDRQIAGESPRGEFTPGHNKWDYAYSIEARPDVIVRGWYDTAEDRALLASTGYTERCLRTPAGSNAVWVLSTSTFVDHGSPLLETCAADATHSS